MEGFNVHLFSDSSYYAVIKSGKMSQKIKFDCFLSYDTSISAASSMFPPVTASSSSASTSASLQQSLSKTSRKVKALVNYLESRHILVYAKSETKFNIKRKKRLYQKIDQCSCVVLLVTKSFLNDRDQLRSEFGYYFRSKGRFHICVAVLDDELLVGTWTGEVGEALKGKKFVDLSSAHTEGLYFKRKCDELYDMIYSTIAPIREQFSTRIERNLEFSTNDEAPEQTFEDETNFDDLARRLYTDLSASTRPRLKGNKDVILRIQKNLKEAISNCTSVENLKKLGSMEVNSLACSIVGLNLEEPDICTCGVGTLSKLCRFGLSLNTQCIENIEIIANDSTIRLVMAAMSKHPNVLTLFLNGLEFFNFILVSKDILSLLCDCDIVALIAKSIHLYILEPEIVVYCASFVTSSVALDKTINIAFGRKECCELLILAIRKSFDHERMCIAACEALISLTISEENRGKIRAAGAKEIITKLREKFDGRAFILMEVSEKLIM